MRDTRQFSPKSAQNVIINTKSRKAFVSGKEVQLAVKEYELLALLCK